MKRVTACVGTLLILGVFLASWRSSLAESLYLTEGEVNAAVRAGLTADPYQNSASPVYLNQLREADLDMAPQCPPRIRVQYDDPNYDVAVADDVMAAIERYRDAYALPAFNAKKKRVFAIEDEDPDGFCRPAYQPCLATDAWRLKLLWARIACWQVALRHEPLPRPPGELDPPAPAGAAKSQALSERAGAAANFINSWLQQEPTAPTDLREGLRLIAETLKTAQESAQASREGDKPPWNVILQDQIRIHQQTERSLQLLHDYLPSPSEAGPNFQRCCLRAVVADIRVLLAIPRASSPAENDLENRLFAARQTAEMATRVSTFLTRPPISEFSELKTATGSRLLQEASRLEDLVRRINASPRQGTDWLRLTAEALGDLRKSAAALGRIAAGLSEPGSVAAIADDADECQAVFARHANRASGTTK